jgi:hypothetical protein
MNSTSIAAPYCCCNSPSHDLRQSDLHNDEGSHAPQVVLCVFLVCQPGLWVGESTRLYQATLGERFLGELCARGADRDHYSRWQRQVRAAGDCQRPVRLVGGIEHVDTASGDIHRVIDSARQPDGVLLKACGTRRAARCQPCAEVYRADAHQLVKAGLAGGKGLPETVSSHPRLFVTFTAPSFGPVHSSRTRRGRIRTCRPARAGVRCPHGRPRRCGLRHLPGDLAVGTPLCPDCYDHQRAVLWNALAPQLWRRTTIALRRAVARQAGLSAAEAGGQVRVAYAKVAEYQARGTIHFHAIIRLDPVSRDEPPPVWATLDLLAAAIRHASSVQVPGPILDGRPAKVGWGDQLDLRPIRDATGELSDGQVAGYLAKYATKATEGLSISLDRPIRSTRQLQDLDAPEHIRRLANACWTLGGRRDLAGLRLRRWTHMLGFGGHFTTKSRRYSTTFRALRAARRAWAASRRHGPAVQLDQDGHLLPPRGAVVEAHWQYAGRGYKTTADAWLAVSMAADHQQARQLAREELSGSA